MKQVQKCDFPQGAERNRCSVQRGKLTKKNIARRTILRENQYNPVTSKVASCLLDTNFILSCIRQKIDFFQEIKLMGIKIIIPREVINELKMLGDREKNLLNLEAKFAIKLLGKHNFEIIDLEGDSADKLIVKFAKRNPDVIIATLDKELQGKIKNRKLIIRGKKRLEII